MNIRLDLDHPRDWQLDIPWDKQKQEKMQSLDNQGLLDVFSKYIESQDRHRLDSHGGYPSDAEVLGSYIVLATVTDCGEPDLNIYSIPIVLEWTRRAIDFVANLAEEEQQHSWYWTDAFEETRPDDVAPGMGLHIGNVECWEIEYNDCLDLPWSQEQKEALQAMTDRDLLALWCGHKLSIPLWREYRSADDMIQVGETIIIMTHDPCDGTSYLQTYTIAECIEWTKRAIQFTHRMCGENDIKEHCITWCEAFDNTE